MEPGECKPLKNIKEFLNWRETKECSKVREKLSHVPSFPKEKTTLTVAKRRKTLVCHDMKGGYTEDRFVDGCEMTEQPYIFYHWASIDYFVYFSHHLVTIPPVGYVAAAHKNGVPILGTLITENKEGVDNCNTLFSSLNSVETAVQQLVNLAVFYKLEGWLINIENAVDKSMVGLIILFLQKLTTAMKTLNANSLVIWYDSITSVGELKWQDELNDKNSCFYDSCDAIFLNYSWTPDKLSRSAEYAKKLCGYKKTGITSKTKIHEDVANNKKKKNVVMDSFYDHFTFSDNGSGAENRVFVGVDVFGRNFYEGGGFNCNKAVQVIAKYNLSAAVFAPGWTHEGLGHENFLENDNRFWSLLNQYRYEHGPDRFPVEADFIDDVCVLKDGKYQFDLMKQGLMPRFWQNDKDGSGVSYVKHDKETGSLVLSNKNQKDNLLISLWQNCELNFGVSRMYDITILYRFQSYNIHDLGAKLESTCLSLNPLRKSEIPWNTSIESDFSGGWTKSTTRIKVPQIPTQIKFIFCVLPRCSNVNIGKFSIIEVNE